MISIRLKEEKKVNSNSYKFSIKKLTSWFTPADHSLSIEYSTGEIDIPINSEDLRRLRDGIDKFLIELEKEMNS